MFSSCPRIIFHRLVISVFHCIFDLVVSLDRSHRHTYIMCLQTVEYDIVTVYFQVVSELFLSFGLLGFSLYVYLVVVYSFENL